MENRRYGDYPKSAFDLLNASCICSIRWLGLTPVDFSDLQLLDYPLIHGDLIVVSIVVVVVVVKQLHNKLDVVSGAPN